MPQVHTSAPIDPITGDGDGKVKRPRQLFALKSRSSVKWYSSSKISGARYCIVTSRASLVVIHSCFTDPMELGESDVQAPRRAKFISSKGHVSFSADQKTGIK